MDINVILRAKQVGISWEAEKMIEQAKALNPEMGFYVASCDHLPFENGEIDVMTVCAAYHHFPCVHKFAKEASRVIKKDGLIYIAEIYLSALLREDLNSGMIVQNVMTPLSLISAICFWIVAF